MMIFLHICCAPCAVYPLSRLSTLGFSSTGYFYNPNIHPFEEHGKRLDAVKHLAALAGVPLIVHGQYEPVRHLARTASRGAQRCEQCYRMRLETTVSAARREGFSLFTTTLLYSRRQKHDLIRGIARETAQQAGLNFYDEDFRIGWNEGIVAAKALNLYRQRYCGCASSLLERNAELRSRLA